MAEPSILAPKEQAFVNAYLGSARMNASEAARQAGYKGVHSGWENLQKPHIRARIDEILNAESMSAAEVLHHLRDVGGSEWRDHVEIQQDKLGRRLRVKMDLSSKVKALELLGKAHKLFTDKQEIGLDGQVDVRVIYDDDAEGRDA